VTQVETIAKYAARASFADLSAQSRKEDGPLLFPTFSIPETEPSRSDRFEVGFGLATRRRAERRQEAEDSFFANSNRAEAWRDKGNVEERTDLRKAFRSSSAADSPIFQPVARIGGSLMAPIAFNRLGLERSKCVVVSPGVRPAVVTRVATRPFSAAFAAIRVPWSG